MFNTKFGPFNGTAWEGLLQQVFKRKYQADGYQEMPASPGDFGIEGFTKYTGWAFQCYCPDKHYERSELYDNLRDKITTDLGKLKTYQADLQARLGDTKISRWIFITPEIDKNALHIHARKKEADVRKWNLPFLSSDFTVLLWDGDHFIVEINEIRTAAGESLIFDERAPILAALNGQQEEYENNVHRKSAARLADTASRPDYQQRVTQVSQLTIENFLQADGLFRRIESTSPTAFAKLVRLINEFEQYVIETSASWSGSAQELTDKVRDGLAKRIADELSEFSLTDANKVARHMTARWLAVCQLNYA